jgi:hypothetical protein
LDELFTELADEAFISGVEVGGLMVFGFDFSSIVGFFKFFNLDMHLCGVHITEGNRKNWRLILIRSFIIFQLKEVDWLDVFSSAEQDQRGYFFSILKVQSGSVMALVYGKGREGNGHIGGVGIRIVVDTLGDGRHSRFGR